MAAGIWVASSRVGASTRPVGWPGRRLASARRATIGIEKASVLPLPVLPRPSTSRPARVSGRVLTWMGNGSVIPRADRLLISRAGTPRSAKDGEVIVVWCLSGIGVCRFGHMVARLPVGKIDRREKAWNGLSEQSTTYWLVDMPTLLNSSSRAGYSDHRVSN